MPWPDAAATAPVARRHTLLYVEDNAVNSLIIRELLAGRADLQLHVAEDGASGVALAAALQPALILLDMQLPDCDGFEVLRRLRTQPATASTPCVALSANAMPDHIERALASVRQRIIAIQGSPTSRKAAMKMTPNTPPRIQKSLAGR